MNENARESYARMVFEVELHETVDITFVDRLDSEDRHARYGLTTPTPPMFEDYRWRLYIAISTFLESVASSSDADFNLWIMYWVVHVWFHIIVFDWTEELGETLGSEAIEERVESAFEEQNPELYALGIKLRSDR